MAYRLKSVRYQGNDRKILLQNENGPCPLLAAANALLLRGAIGLPSVCIRNGCASLEEVVNMLAEKAMNYSYNKQADLHALNSEKYVHEVLDVLPKLQYGMDVNPKFTNGPTGMEFTTELTTFDLLNVKMVHGWLVDPQAEELCGLVGCKTYNELIEMVIHGNEATAELRRLDEQLLQLEKCSDNVWIHVGVPADGQTVAGLCHGRRQSVGQLRGEFKEKQEALSKRATVGSLINSFLESTGHQLTQYGLSVLYEHLEQNELCVFFRNNHFSTLTKHDGVLYLLVTDLGYANVFNVVWEKLDVIDGDTEYVDAEFSRPAPHTVLSAKHQSSAGGCTLDPEQLLAQRSQSEVDYQLALELSGMSTVSTAGGKGTPNSIERVHERARLDEREGEMMGVAIEASLRTYNGVDDGNTASISNNCTRQEDQDRLLAMQMQAGMEQQDMRLAKHFQEIEWAQPETVTDDDRADNPAADVRNANCVVS